MFLPRVPILQYELYGGTLHVSPALPETAVAREARRQKRVARMLNLKLLRNALEQDIEQMGIKDAIYDAAAKRKEALLALPPAASECQEEVANAVLLAKSARRPGDASDEVLQRAADEAVSGHEKWGIVDIESDSAEDKSDSEEKENRLVKSTPYCDHPAFDWLIRLKAGEVSYGNTPERIVAEAKNANRTLTRENSAVINEIAYDDPDRQYKSYLHKCQSILRQRRRKDENDGIFNRKEIRTRHADRLKAVLRSAAEFRVTQPIPVPADLPNPDKKKKKNKAKKQHDKLRELKFKILGKWCVFLSQCLFERHWPEDEDCRQIVALFQALTDRSAAIDRKPYRECIVRALLSGQNPT